MQGGGVPQNGCSPQARCDESPAAHVATRAAFRDGRRAGTAWRYRGAITREQWLLNETRTVARLRLESGLSDDEILERNLSQNLFQYPTERELRSITRACFLRLDNLSEDGSRRHALTRLIVNGTPTQSRQTNLYAMMRTYRVVWEFAVAVLGPKFTTFDYRLEKREIVAFLESLRTQDERVATWSDATVNKIRQVLTKCLVEAGYLESVRSDELHPILLDLELEQAIRGNGDAVVLPAFNCLD